MLHRGHARFATPAPTESSAAALVLSPNLERAAAAVRTIAFPLPPARGGRSRWRDRDRPDPAVPAPQGLADSPNLERLLTGLGTTALAVALARTGRSLWRRRTRPPGGAPCVGELLLCPDGQRTPGASYQRRGEPARGASASWAELSSRRLRDVRKSHEQEFHSNQGLMLVWREHRRAATDYRDSGSPVFGAPAHKGGEESNGGFGVSALPIDPRARGRFAGHRVVRVMRQMR